MHPHNGPVPYRGARHVNRSPYRRISRRNAQHVGLISQAITKQAMRVGHILAVRPTSSAAQVIDPAALLQPWLELVPERLVAERIGSRLPIERVILPATARPWIERVDDPLQLGGELGHRAQKHALERQHLLPVTVGFALLPLLVARSIVVDPVDAEPSVECRAKVGGEETIAEEPP